MLIGNRLRTIRVEKKLSQGDLERRSGLRRAYISRVENGYTVPSVETLEKLARGLEVPIHHIFYDSEMPPDSPKPYSRRKQLLFLRKLSPLLGRMDEEQRELLFYLAQKMAKN